MMVLVVGESVDGKAMLLKDIKNIQHTFLNVTQFPLCLIHISTNVMACGHFQLNFLYQTNNIQYIFNLIFYFLTNKDTEDEEAEKLPSRGKT